MTIDGLGTPTPGAPGLAGPRPASTTLPLADALALLGLSTEATVEEARTAVRSALANLQAQVSAGSMDSSAFRTKAAGLAVALNSIVTARPPAASPAGTPTPGLDTVDVQGLTTPPPGAVPPGAADTPDPDRLLGRTPSGTGSPAPSTAAPNTAVSAPQVAGPPASPSTALQPPTSATVVPTPTGQPVPTADVDAPGVVSQPQLPGGVRLPSGNHVLPGPVAPPTGSTIATPPADPTGPLEPHTPSGSTAPSSPAFDPDPAVALSVLPLLAHRPPTAAQIDLWNAAVLPNIAQHVDTARAAASDAGARTEQQLAAATTYGVLTHVLASLPHERRRDLQVLAMGVYDQLEAALPYAVVAGLPPRDHLGLLSFHALLPSADFKPALLLLLGALVALALWAGLR